MRKKHELDKGVICEMCMERVTDKTYKRIVVSVPVKEDSTGKTVFIDRHNLCSNCYEVYSKSFNRLLKKE